MNSIFASILKAYACPKVPVGLLPDRNSSSLFSSKYSTHSERTARDLGWNIRTDLAEHR